MKNVVSFIFLLALLVSGCTQEEMLKNGTTSVSGKGRTFTTEFEQNDSRTYVENGLYSRWTEGDCISLFDASTLNCRYLFAGDTGDSGGTFFMLSKPEGTSTTLNTNYAVYPYSEDVKMTEDGVISVTLPSEQHYAENSYGLGDNTMVAVTEDADDTFLSFKNVGGCLKLQLYGDDVTVKSITLMGNDGELISGNATITATYDKTPVVTMADDDATTSITLDCGEKGVKIGSSAEDATAFWMVVPPTTFEEGVTVIVIDTDGKAFAQTTDKQLVIERNVVKPMAAVKAKMEPVTPKLTYSADTDELEDWSEALFCNDGSYYMAKPSDDNGCIVIMGNLITEENALIYIDENRCVREVSSDNNIFTFNNYTENSVDISCFDENGARITETVVRNVGALSRSSDNHEQEINGVNLGLNMWSIKEAVNDVFTGKNIYKHARGWQTYSWNVFNAVGTVFEMAGFSESDLFNNNATMVIGAIDNLISIGEMGVELVKSLKIKDLKLKPGVGNPAVWAITAWLGFRETYLELFDEHIKAYYGNSIASIGEIKYENNVLNIGLNVSGYESWYDLECGVIVKKSNLPVALPAGRFPSDAETKIVTGNGNYSFSVGDIEEGQAYWCYPYLVSQSRDALWIGFIGNWAGPLVRYGKAVKYEVDPMREALIKLYESTNGDNWTRNDNWLDLDKPITEWYGVVKKNNNKYALYLDGNNLTGTINQTFPNDINVELSVSNNNLTSINVSGCTSLTNLNCQDNKLTSLNVSGCTSLTRLYCDGNQLSSLDISSCTSLTWLQCGENQLASLDVSGCTSLEFLNCIRNSMASLDASGCTALSSLYCFENQLTSLDVSGCRALTALNCANNKLISLDAENCESLTELNVNGHSLTSLNVSGCISLTNLYCQDNKLTSLNVSGCTALDWLFCDGNQLSSLDISSCTALTWLQCGENQLTSFDVSGCTSLETLNCIRNSMTSLNVSGCTSLSSLYCFDNQLTSLNVSGCTALDWLRCENNKITSVIPGWFSQLEAFGHDARYIYWKESVPDGDGGYVTITRYEDQGKGWWYPGEPEKGEHSPN